MGGGSANANVPALPEVDNPFVLQYLVKNKENQVMSGKPYIFLDDEGNIHKGTTDKDGFMKLKTTSASQNVTTRIMMNEIEQADEEEAGAEE